MCDLDIEREIRLTERKSATGDRKWRASCPEAYDGFGETPELALVDFIHINAN